jgi:hypothetical protein
MSNVITLNDQGVCVGVKQVKLGYELQANESVVDFYDTSIVGKTYDPSTGEFAYTQAQIEDQAREWRDAELKRTDSIMLLPDYPQKEALTAYRQELRDWPNTDQFPDTRPQLA